MAAMYDGWEYPPPHMYSAEHKDGEGYLRVRGKLLKKGGSRRGSAGGGGEVGGAPSGRPARTRWAPQLARPPIPAPVVEG